MVLYVLTMAIFLAGLYATMAKKNIMKIVIGMLIMDYAVNLMLVLIGYRRDGLPPIMTSPDEPASAFVDPLPQALIVTSIVIGLAMTALMAALCVRLYQRYGTFDTLHMRKLKG
ncbi:MAG TPA: sodium:proton antiporter [Planctomycetota bacterium]|nr:sodium:proton antiporter [Planctomycetota bacterium]